MSPPGFVVSKYSVLIDQLSLVHLFGFIFFGDEVWFVIIIIIIFPISKLVLIYATQSASIIITSLCNIYNQLVSYNHIFSTVYDRIHVD